MVSKAHKQLEEARTLFHLGRLGEAYNILRRYFDRLPFRPEKGHAEYIGIFARILLELGKEFELKFYMGELERHYEKSKDPSIAYPLAVVYAYLPEPKMETAKAVLEEILRNPIAVEYHAKAKMMLADYYERKDDIASCRSIVDSIEPTADKTTNQLVEVWRGVVLMREGRYDEALLQLRALTQDLCVEADWYVYFSAQLNIAMVLVEQGKEEEARSVISEVKKIFEGRPFKSAQIQLAALEKQLEEKNQLGIIRFSPKAGVFTYANKSLRLTNKTPVERLLLLLLKRGFLDKALIVKNLYDRQYGGEKDDKLVYYHIHSLRKRLKAFGLPADAITNEENGYRLVPEVQTEGGEL